jgi:hypothetical protein
MNFHGFGERALRLWIEASPHSASEHRLSLPLYRFFLNLYSRPTEMAKFTSHCVALFP